MVRPGELAVACRIGEVQSGWDMTRTIKNQLLTAFVAVALCTGALGLFAIVTLERLSQDQLTMYGDVFEGTHLLANWVESSWEARSDVARYLRTEDADERIRLQARMTRADAELSQLARRMDLADSDRQDVETLAGLERAWDSYAALRNEISASVTETGDISRARATYESDEAASAAAIDLAIDSFVAKKAEVAAQLEHNAQLSYEVARIVAIGLSAFAAGLALVIGWLLSRSIARAVGQVGAAAKGLAAGDIDQHIDVSSPREFGEMAHAFRDLIAYQQEMACVAEAIAAGDLSQQVEPRGAKDVLGTAFQLMTRNLQALVSELEGAVSQTQQFLEENRRLHERVRQAARRTTSLNEQSLRRLGADLHDGPCQALAFALLRLETIKTDYQPRVDGAGDDTAGDAGVEERPPPGGALDQSDTLGAVRAAVQDALNEIRAISGGLRLPQLNPLSVPMVVEHAVRHHERRSGTAVRVDVDSLPEDVPLEVKIVLYRALQEALSNATRHGRGVAVSVRVRTDERRLRLTVRDQGPGFDPVQAERTGRLGLATMRERAQLLGGSFRLETAPGRGTRVHLDWPVPRAAAHPAGPSTGAPALDSDSTSKANSGRQAGAPSPALVTVRAPAVEPTRPTRLKWPTG